MTDDRRQTDGVDGDSADLRDRSPSADGAAAFAAGSRESVARAGRGGLRLRVFSVGAGTVAVVLFGLGWVRAVNEGDAASFAGPVALTLLGLALVGVIAALQVAQVRGPLAVAKRSVAGPWPATAGPAPAARPGGDADQVLVVEGLALYHRPNCQMAADRRVREMAAGSVPAGLRPCGLCEPDSGA